MKTFSFTDFMNNHILINDAMKDSEIQRFYKNPINPRNSKINSDKGFVNIDDGSQDGTQWTCFIIKDNKSYYFDRFGGAPVSFSLNQLLNQ